MRYIDCNSFMDGQSNVLPLLALRCLKGSWTTFPSNHRLTSVLEFIASLIDRRKNFSNPSKTSKVTKICPTIWALALFSRAGEWAGSFTGRDDMEERSYVTCASWRWAHIMKHDRSLQVRFQCVLVYELCNATFGLCQMSTNRNDLLCDERSAVWQPFQ